MSAGLAALVGAYFLGRRHSHISKEAHRPANIPYVILGTGMLWFGWFGFNAGSALAASDQAALAFATTNTASAAAMLTWMFMDVLRGQRPSALGACIGAVVGLVAVTPAAGFITVAHSLVFGAVGSIVSHFAVHIKSKSQLDDTLDVFPCHGVGGITGMILTGVFARGLGLFYGETTTFFVHLLALIAISIFVIIVSYILYLVADRLIPMRVERQAELIGLDLSQHDETHL